MRRNNDTKRNHILKEFYKLFDSINVIFLSTTYKTLTYLYKQVRVQHQFYHFLVLSRAQLNLLLAAASGLLTKYIQLINSVIEQRIAQKEFIENKQLEAEKYKQLGERIIELMEELHDMLEKMKLSVEHKKDDELLLLYKAIFQLHQEIAYHRNEIAKHHHSSPIRIMIDEQTNLYVDIDLNEINKEFLRRIDHAVQHETRIDRNAEEVINDFVREQIQARLAENSSSQTNHLDADTIMRQNKSREGISNILNVMQPEAISFNQSQEKSKKIEDLSIKIQAEKQKHLNSMESFPSDLYVQPNDPPTAPNISSREDLPFTRNDLHFEVTPLTSQEEPSLSTEIELLSELEGRVRASSERLNMLNNEIVELDSPSERVRPTSSLKDCRSQSFFSKPSPTQDKPNSNKPKEEKEKDNSHHLHPPERK